MSDEDVCAEFAKNFATLQVKYEELRVRYTDSQQRNKELSAKIEHMAKEIGRRDDDIATLKAEKADLAAHRERATKATIAVEHLRGRIESQQKNFEDRELEHKHEVDQVRAQLQDALNRVAHGTDHAAVAAVSTQKIEMEERCAVVSSQLVEEKERAAQAQLASVATVRDVSSRNLELEQRVRSLDTEVSSLRSRAQRAADQVADASLERERVLLENNTLHSKIATLTRDLQSASSRAEDRERQLERRINEERTRSERERDEVSTQLAEANQRVTDMMTQRAQDADRVASLQRAAVAKLESARAELEADLEAATSARHGAVEECQRIKAKLAQERVEAEEARSHQRQAEARVQALQQTVNSLQAKLEASAQNEAWLTSERDRFVATTERGQKRAEELSAALSGAEQRLAEADRAALQLDDARRDIADLQDARERDAAGMKRLEEAYCAKVEVVKRELKVAKRQYTQALHKEARQKKILLRALLEKEQALASGAGGPITDDMRQRAGSIDAVALLKAQGEKARQFEERIRELYHPEATSPTRTHHDHPSAGDAAVTMAPL